MGSVKIANFSLREAKALVEMNFLEGAYRPAVFDVSPRNPLRLYSYPSPKFMWKVGKFLGCAKSLIHQSAVLNNCYKSYLSKLHLYHKKFSASKIIDVYFKNKEMRISTHFFTNVKIT